MKLKEVKTEINRQLSNNKTDIMNHECELEWSTFKSNIEETINEHQKTKGRNRPNKHWITEETLKVIEERRNIANKTNDQVKYAHLNREIQRRCRIDKNEYIKKVCEEIEKHKNTNQTRDLFQKVNLLSRKFKPKTMAIEDKDGTLLWETEKVLNRWAQYCKELYSDDRDLERQYSEHYEEEEAEPNILTEEVIEAIQHLKTNKSPGIDHINAEILKILEEPGIEILLDICNKIRHTKKWPSDWTKSIFIPLHKKGSTKNCGNYRTVSLISHASKILLRIIDRRLQRYLDSQIPPEQAGRQAGETKSSILDN